MKRMYRILNPAGKLVAETAGFGSACEAMMAEYSRDGKDGWYRILKMQRGRTLKEIRYEFRGKIMVGIMASSFS
ncbi:MAG: hypothetical protein HY368_03160 [Candidatus Aenigmarchaeota archaeon]|nr:hypothetical protein [Candidatus Aenigmarchaeota archaeon]